MSDSKFDPFGGYDHETLLPCTDEAQGEQELAKTREASPLWHACAARGGRPLEELRSLVVVAVGRMPDGREYVTGTVEGELSLALLAAVDEMNSRVQESAQRFLSGEAVPPEKRPT